MVAALLVMFVVGVVLFATSALLAPYLQTLAGYPVFTAGLLMAPRGVGTMVAMLIVGRLTSRVDPRALMAFGILVMCWTLWEMTGWTPDVDRWGFAFATVLQGFGLGFVFIPLQVVAFATLDPALRTDGTAMLSLLRNVGSAIGISACQALLTRNVQINHSEIVQHVTPLNRAFEQPGVEQFWNLSTRNGLATLDAEVTRQAQVIAYVNDFKLLLWLSLPLLLLLFLMSRPPRSTGSEAEHVALD
ncbi:MFS transporter [Roseomonas chloroacetimidivorans]|uniref:MFS transporter n=1 Tax=Roseomonas chloroacetimidivorans TaxID=1766656 RepID=UPI003C77B131